MNSRLSVSFYVYDENGTEGIFMSNYLSATGMLAAESAFNTLQEGSPLESFWDNLRTSWIWKELYSARNYRPVSIVIDLLCDLVHFPSYLYLLDDKYYSLTWSYLNLHVGQGYGYRKQFSVLFLVRNLFNSEHL